ncbi:MAG: dephospho-CoA kinase [Terriglobales bacterium]
MLRVGLTGGLGAGKSTVAGWLSEAGIPVLDADQVAHQLLTPGAAGVAPVVAAFGPEMLDAAGHVDRAKLAARVFADPGERRRLEAILHPRIIAATNQWLDEMERQGHATAVVEAALIFEAGTAHRFDRVIAVVCPPEQKLARWLRAGGNRADAEARLAAQLPDAEKVRRADWVVENATDLADARRQTQAIIAQLLAVQLPDSGRPRR